MVVYVGAFNIVTAVSSVDGRVLWIYDFDHFISARIPSIVVCGTRIFLAGAGEAVCLNAADGKLMWKSKLKGFGRMDFGNAAWDGANRVCLGVGGYVLRIDLRDGSQSDRINLKGTGYYPVNITFDNYRQVFYALTNGKLFAISAGDDNKIVWTCDSRLASLTNPYNSMAVDPMTGRIYVAYKKNLSCVGSNGRTIFTVGFEESVLSRNIYALTLDIAGSGLVLVGGGGCCRVFDAEGHLRYSDDLPGMRYEQTTMCTATASFDPNASGHCQNKQDFIQRSNNN